jgi:ankyrin repeat protein
VAARAVSRWIVGLGGAFALLSALPAGAQLYSDGYKFLKAVKDKDGTVVNELLSTPGSTVINARDLSTGETGLHYATQRRDVTWIRFLTGRGANPNIRDKSGVTPLMIATRLGFNEGVEALIAGGASVDVATSSGETPLISAVHRRDPGLMRLLLQAGADPDRNDNSGRSARYYASLTDKALTDAIERFAKPEGERESANVTYGPSF